MESAVAKPRRKRRPVGACPNPLFVKWVEEWRDEAREEGSKVQYAYTKALNSLKKYPLPLVSGQEAKILGHIGEKLAKKLDKKLLHYTTTTEGGVSGSIKKPRVAQREGEDSNCSVRLPPPKGKRRRSKAEYVPEYRSGPYAIIIALYRAQQRPSWSGHLTKAQLMTQAQPHSDKSFTIPDDGKYYTAWSSMTTLIRKGLVDKRSCPAKYRLTEAGEDMANRLEVASLSLSTLSSPSLSTSPTSSLTTTTTTKSSSQTKRSSSPTIRPHTSQKKPSRELKKSTKLHQSQELSSDDEVKVMDGVVENSMPYNNNMYINNKQNTNISSISTSSGPLMSPIASSSSYSTRYPSSVIIQQTSSSVSPSWCEGEDTQTTTSTAAECFTKRQGDSSKACVITLSDSSDDSRSNSSDVECLPSLAARISARTHGGDVDTVKIKKKNTVEMCCVAETPVSSGSSRDNVIINSVEVAGKLKERQRRRGVGRSITPPRTTCRRPVVTPAKMAGQAALCRLQKSGGSENGKCMGRPDLVDLSGVNKTPSCKKRREFEEDEDDELPVAFPLRSPKIKPISIRAQNNINPSTSVSSLPSSNITQDCRKTSSNIYKDRPLPTSNNHSRPPLNHSRPPPPNHSRPPPINSRPPLNHSRPSSCDTTCHSSVRSGDSEGSNPPSLDIGTPLFQLKPGEFDVVLCIDSAESTASRKSNSQFRGVLLQELAKYGVNFEVRKLNVGDFLWIAREKRTTPLPGQLVLPRSREAVLEYIVERKRMDDLAGSITDGRFREQKFRLQHCGVKHPMYLVEEFQDKMHLKLRHRSLEQAISNIQVIDEFPVHRTTDIRDSVDYLTLFTRQLQQHYAGKTVQAYPWDAISQLNNPASSKEQVGVRNTSLPPTNAVLAIEFTSFNESSIKNKVLNAYEMFGRHLMQVPSVSAERAAAILDYFPTVTALREAYCQCKSGSERETLISSLKAGQNRSLGKNIGKTLCGLYRGH